MHPNNPQQNLTSSDNPNSIEQLHPNSGYPQQLKKNICRKSFTQKQSLKSQDKKQYLTLVTRPKRPQKRQLLKNNKKNTQKKSQSVVLGGQKKTNFSMTHSQKSFKSSLCKFYTNQHQSIPIHVEPAVNHNMHTVQLGPNLLLGQTYSQSLRHNNQHLNRIISHKLNLVNIQPHQPFFRLNRFVQVPVQTGTKRFGGKMIRNASSVGRIYFSAGKSVDRKQVSGPEIQNPLQSPNYQVKNQHIAKKRRQKAGFIRSASAPKTLINQNNMQGSTEKTVNTFDPSLSKAAKQFEIEKCFQKMSQIRKQIDELQQFLQDRLETSQLKNKYMYNTLKNVMSSQILLPQKREESFQVFDPNRRVNMTAAQSYTPINSFLRLVTEENDAKTILGEVKSSSLNKGVSQKQFNQAPQTIQSIYQMKCLPSAYSSDLEKQLISQIASVNLKSKKQNQQNFFYHKNLVNSLR